MLDRVVRAVRALTGLCVVLCASVFTTVVVAQVFYRYALNDSLVWSEELVRYALLWTVLLGAGLASDRREHVAVGVLETLLPAPGRRALELVNALLVLAFCACLVWFGIRFAGRAALAVSPAAGYPMAWVYAAMPVGGALVAFFTLGALRHRPRAEDPLTAAEREGL